MDVTSVSVAVVLLLILLAWYALLEYEDRHGEENVRGTTRPPAKGLRRARRLSGREAGGEAPRRFGRSNGHRPPRQGSAGAGRAFVFRGSYGLAAAGVLVSFALVALGDYLLSITPFIFLAAAVALAFTLSGRGPGLFALLLATLLSDFFFVEPAFVFSLDWQVFRLSLVYLLGGLLSVIISRRPSSRPPA